MFEMFSDADENVDKSMLQGKVKLGPTITFAEDSDDAIDVNIEMRMLDHIVEGISFLPHKPNPCVSLVGFRDHPDWACDTVMMTNSQYRKRAIVKYKKCIELLDGELDMIKFDVTEEKREALLAYYRFALKVETDDAVTIICPDGCAVSLAVGQIAHIECGDVDIVGVVTQLKPTYRNGKSCIIVSTTYIDESFENGRCVSIRDVVIDADVLGSGKINVTRFTPSRSQSVDKLKTIVDYVLVIRALLTNYESLLPLSLLSYQAVADGLMPFKNKIDEVLADENDG